MTFAQLAEDMRTAGAAFIAAGLRIGERVAIWAPNSLDWIVACLGLQAAGGVLVPLNTRFRGEEARYVLSRAHVAMLVVVDSFLGQDYRSLLSDFELPDLRRTIAFGTNDGSPSSFEAFLAGAPRAARVELDRRLAGLSEGDVSDIMFTSGTTGDPKGAVTTHEQTTRTALLWTRATTLGNTDRYLILWPFFHCAGYKAGWVACLGAGATALPERTLDVERLVDRVDQEGVTFLPGPPTLFQTLLSQPTLDVHRLRSIRVSVTGASSVAPSLIEAMRNSLRIGTVLTGYGLTETCGTVTLTSPADPPDIVVTSCGKAIDGIEIKIVDDAGASVPTGAPGEILVRGMNVMREYLDDPVATAEVLQADGWFHTGDVGTLDRDGYLRITDRKKNMFIVGGFNCYPAEIEKMLQAHPSIMQAAVIGVPDERLGEVGRAYVMLKPGAALTAESLIAWSRDKMANFKVPRYVDFVDALPINATGKVQKYKLGS
jgi:acyl-CoA synthetase (AMP-forming)/AMP-acid ligase II